MRNKLKELLKNCLLSLVISFCLIKTCIFLYTEFYKINLRNDRIFIFLIFLLGLLVCLSSNYFCEFKKYSLLNKSFALLLTCLLIVFEITAYFLFPYFKLLGKSIIILILIISIFLLYKFCKNKHSSNNIDDKNDSENYVSLQKLYQGPVKIDLNKPLLIKEKDADFDLFDRKTLMEELKADLESCKGNQCYVIGIEGKWGCGKTTLLNLLKKDLKDDTTCVDFDIWNYATNDSLFIGLYKTLFAGFGYRSNAILTNRILKNVTETLVNKSSNKTFYIPLIHELFFSSLDGYKDFEELNGKLRSISINSKKQLVVIVDNLERCDANQIIFFLKMLNNLSSISNTVFLVAYSQNRLDKLIEENKDVDSHYYEKVINHVIKISYVSSAKYRDVLDTCTTNYLLSYGISNEQLKEFDFLKYYLSKYSRTPREYIRTVNSCFSKVFPNRTYLNIVDLLSISIIRFKNDHLLNYLASNASLFVSDNRNLDDYNLADTREKREEDRNNVFKKCNELYAEFSIILAGIFPMYKNFYFSKNYTLSVRMETDLFVDSRINEVPISDGNYFYPYLSEVMNNSIVKFDEIKKTLYQFSRNDAVEFDDILRSKNINQKIENLSIILLCVQRSDLKLNYSMVAEKIVDNIHECNYCSDNLRNDDFYFECEIIAKCIEKISLDELIVFLNEHLSKITNLFVMEEIGNILKHKDYEHNNEKMNCILNSYNSLCESILNEKINLYSDQNYRFRNIIGLNRYCIKNNKVNELKIYYEKNINSLNVMRFLGDCLQMGYSLIGNDKSYIYSINLEYWNNFDDTVKFIDSRVQNYVPKNETEKMILEIYNNSKNNKKNDDNKFYSNELIQFAGNIS